MIVMRRACAQGSSIELCRVTVCVVVGVCLCVPCVGGWSWSWFECMVGLLECLAMRQNDFLCAFSLRTQECHQRAHTHTTPDQPMSAP